MPTSIPTSIPTSVPILEPTFEPTLEPTLVPTLNSNSKAYINTNDSINISKTEIRLILIFGILGMIIIIYIFCKIYPKINRYFTVVTDDEPNKLSLQNDNDNGNDNGNDKIDNNIKEENNDLLDVIEIRIQ